MPVFALSLERLSPRRHTAVAVVAALSLSVASCGGAGGGVDAHDHAAEHAGNTEKVTLQTFEFGGDFTLAAHTGRPFDLADVRGRAVLLFFGYTYCPDVCPTTLGTMAQVERMLGEDRNRLQTVFVSVDPERDTIPRLKEYVDHFGINAVAVTGTKAEVDEVVGKYAAYYEKQASDSAMGYLVDHTSRLYLIDGAGRIRYLFRYGEDATRIVEGVRLVLAESPS